MKEKDRFRKAPPNYAMKKTQLLKDKVKIRMFVCHLTQRRWFINSLPVLYLMPNL